MEPVTASVTNQQKPECWICLGELAGKFHDFVLTHCCKTIVHTRCLQDWKEQKQSLVGRNICEVKPNHAYLRCGVCGHNALPLVNLDTIVYSNSKSTSYCKSDLAEYLQQYIASNQANSSGDDQSGAGAVSNRTIATLAPTAGPPAGSANDATSSDGKIPDLPTLVRLGLKRRHDDMRAGIQELLQVQACVVGDQAMLEEIANQDPSTVCSKQEAVMYCGEAVPLVSVAAEHNQTSCVKTLANKSEYMFSWSFKDALDNDDPKTLAMLVQCDDKGLSGKYLVQAIEQRKSKNVQMLLAAGVDRNMAVMEVIDHYQSAETISSLIDLGFSCGQIIFMAAQANNRRLLRDLTQLPELRRIFGHADCVEATILAAQQDNHAALRALTDIVPLEEALCASVGDQNEAAIAALLNEGACYADALSHAVSTSQRAVFDQLLIRNTGDCGYFLRLAAQNGDAELVDALLDADVGDIDSHTYADTPLAVAARNSHAEVVKLLYFALPPERRVDVIAQAVVGGTETELQSLLATCEDAKQMFHLMRRVIDYVLDHPDYGQPVIRQLLRKIHTGKTAIILSEALDNKDYKTLATLLAAGADANT
ncbi:ankyrin repeat domain-containing protein, partial [Endozoicomonas sp. ONNA2]|uniref:ankyrin repeat domain-containing protein n=1 Tax=Endozoicomonas sp. ONNA2 TaxID=2828741 RepID=UPI00214950FA